MKILARSIKLCTSCFSTVGQKRKAIARIGKIGYCKSCVDFYDVR